MSDNQGISTNTVIAGGVIAVLLMVCAGGGMSLATVLVLSLFAGGDSGSSKPVRYEPLTIGVQEGDEEIHHTRTAPLILQGEVSGPPTTRGAFEREQCGDIVDGGPVEGPDCVTQEIRCDQQIISHTLGGVDRYDTKFYEKNFCWPATIDHDGGDERVFKLVMPAGEWRAWVDLHSPCADLDIMAMRYDKGRGECPQMGNVINQCEMAPVDGPASERIELTSQTRGGKEAVWYVVVEGKDGEEGPFSLYVQCARGLGGAL